MRFKSLTNDQTVPRYRYFNFFKPHKVDGKGFSSQIPTLKTVPSDQKSNRRTCAEVSNALKFCLRRSHAIVNPYVLTMKYSDHEPISPLTSTSKYISIFQRIDDLFCKFLQRVQVRSAMHMRRNARNIC